MADIAAYGRYYRYMICEKGATVLDLTTNCITKFREILVKEDKPDAGVRLFMSAGG